MKNLTLVAAFILSGLFQLQASHRFSTAKLTVLQNEKSIILNTSNQSKRAEVLKITDSKAKVVFTDVIEKNKHRVKYVLNNLPNGRYYITVKGSDVFTIYETIISDKNVNIADTKSYYRPSIHPAKEKLSITAAVEKKEEIHVSIYDDSNILVFTYNMEKEKTFTQAFNLEQLPKGDYEVIVSTEYFVEQSNITL